jgi:HEAT repeat protein
VSTAEPSFNPNLPCFIKTLKKDVLRVIFENFLSNQELATISLVCKKWRIIIQPVLAERQFQQFIRKKIERSPVRFEQYVGVVPSTPKLIRYTLDLIAKHLMKQPADFVHILGQIEVFSNSVPFDDLRELTVYLKPFFEHPEAKLRYQALKTLQTIIMRVHFLYAPDQKYSISTFLEDCCKYLAFIAKNEGSYESKSETIGRIAVGQIGRLAEKKYSVPLRKMCFNQLIDLTEFYPEAFIELQNLVASRSLSIELRQWLFDQFVKLTKRNTDFIKIIGEMALSAKLPGDFKERVYDTLIAFTNADQNIRHTALKVLVKKADKMEEPVYRKCCEAFLRICHSEAETSILKEAEIGLLRITNDLDPSLFERSCMVLANLAQNTKKDRGVRINAVHYLGCLLRQETTPLLLREEYASVFLPLIKDEDVLQAVIKLFGFLGSVKDMSMPIREECCKALIPLLDNPDKKIRKQTIKSLGKIGASQNIHTEIRELCSRALIGLTKNHDVLFRQTQAIGGMLRIGDLTPDTMKRGCELIIQKFHAQDRNKRDRDVANLKKIVCLKNLTLFNELPLPLPLHKKCCVALCNTLIKLLDACQISSLQEFIMMFKAVINSPSVPLELREKSLRALIKYTSRDVSEVRKACACALIEIATTPFIHFDILEQCVKALIRIVHRERNKHESRRSEVKSAIKGLLTIGVGKFNLPENSIKSIRKSCFEALFSLSMGEEKHICNLAIGHLGAIGAFEGASPSLKEQCYKSLLELAKDEKSEIRSQVVKGFIKMIAGPIVPPVLRSLCFAELIKLSQDLEDDVLCAVAINIKWVGRSSYVPYAFQKQSYEVLLRLSQNNNGCVRADAAASLCRLASHTKIPSSLHQKFFEALLRLSQDKELNVIESLAQSLGDLSSSISCGEDLRMFSFDILVKLSFEWMCQEAGISLGKMGSSEYTPEMVRYRCCEALIQLAKREDLWYRSQVAAIEGFRMLGNSGYLISKLRKQCRETLVMLSYHVAEDVRNKAMAVLRLFSRNRLRH